MDIRKKMEDILDTVVHKEPASPMVDEVVAAFDALREERDNLALLKTDFSERANRAECRLALADALVEAVEEFRAEIAPLKSKTIKEGQLWVKVSQRIKAYRSKV